MQLLYAFNPAFAAESFREAQAADPDCAMCYFGEAWALGPYLNGPMRADNAAEAYEAALKAKDLAQDRSNEIERALIDAMATRYERSHDADRRPVLDSIYSEAMGDVFKAYPDDPEVGTLYGESLMLQLPRRGNWDINDPEVRKVHRALEHVLARDIRHPGACHLYIHATESTTSPEKAENCADYQGDAIPGASHIQHMPSHTYNRVGRWADAVRANTYAWHADQKAEYDEGVAIYPSHNVHMLLFAASMDGQGAVASQAAREYEKVVRDGQFYRSLVLTRFGRFDEVLEVTEPPAPPTFRGLWQFGRGYAHLKMGQADSAAAYLDMIRLEIDNMPEGEGFRGHPGENLLTVVAGILEVRCWRWTGGARGRSRCSKPQSKSKTASATTSPSRSTSRLGTGWARFCWRTERAPRRNECIARLWTTIRTTAGACSAWSRRSGHREERCGRPGAHSVPSVLGARGRVAAEFPLLMSIGRPY